MSRGFRLLLYSAAVAAVLLGTGVWVLRRPLRDEAARVWSREVTALAVEVESFKYQHGSYPVAFSGEAVRAALGRRAGQSSVVDDGMPQYRSDGASYAVSLTVPSRGAVSSATLVYEIRDGEWYLWPECLTDDVRRRSREQIQAAKSGTTTDNRQSNQRINASHSVVTALAQDGKRRAAGRARYAHRWTDD